MVYANNELAVGKCVGKCVIIVRIVICMNETQLGVYLISFLFDWNAFVRDVRVQYMRVENTFW